MIYRIWDRQNKFFFNPTHEAYNGKLCDLFIGVSGDLFMRTMDNIAHESTFPDRFVKSRSIGRKDDKGVAMFEGDIVKAARYMLGGDFEPTKERYNECTGVIHWSDEMCGYVIEDGLHDDPVAVYDSYEVVANIYDVGVII